MTDRVSKFADWLYEQGLSYYDLTSDEREEYWLIFDQCFPYEG